MYTQDKENKTHTHTLLYRTISVKHHDINVTELNSHACRTSESSVTALTTLHGLFSDTVIFSPQKSCCGFMIDRLTDKA